MQPILNMKICLGRESHIQSVHDANPNKYDLQRNITLKSRTEGVHEANHNHECGQCQKIFSQ